MVSFSDPMGFGKVEQFNITAPSRYSFNAFVDENSTCLACMVRAKFSEKVWGQVLCHK
jgi:hypothetical protein